VSKTVYIAEGSYTFEMADTYLRRRELQYGAGEFKITMNGEPVVSSSSGEFRDVARESFDGPTVDYRMDAAYEYEDYPYETSWSLQSLATGAVVVASGFNEVTEFGYLFCRSLSAWFLATSTSL
jgi:hypothetical protein